VLRKGWWCGLLCLLTAATAEAKAKKPRVVLLDIPADAAFPPNVTKTLNDFLAGALADQGLDVVTSQDITAVLGLEKQKELLGCSDGSCLAELGGALGADYVVRGNMAVLDTETAVALTLLDARGRAVQMKRKKVSGKSSAVLLAALEDLVPPLVAPIQPAHPPEPSVAGTAPPAPSTIITPAPAVAPAPAGGLTASSAQAGSGPPTGALIALGAGAAGLVGAGICSGLSYASYQQFRDQASRGASAATLSGTHSTSNAEAAAAWGLLGAGVVGVAVGGYLWLSGS
jgi:hypothetical protein